MLNKIGLRPGDFNATGSAHLDLKVEMVEHLGVETYVYARFGKGDLLTISAHGDELLKAGDALAAHFDPASMLMFGADGARIR